MSTQPETGHQQNQSDMQLRARWLIFARGVWFTFAGLALVLFVIAIPARYQSLITLCEGSPCVPGQLSTEGMQALIQLGLSHSFYALYVVAMELTFFTVMGAVGAIIFWRKSDDWMAVLVSLALVMLGAVTGAPLDALTASEPMWRVPVGFIRAPAAASLALFYLFPNGQFVPRWSRVLVILVAAWPFATLFTPFDYPSLPSLLIILGCLAIGAGAQIYRYRYVSTVVERQQTKWVMFGFTAACLGAVEFVLPPLLLPSLVNPPNGPVISQMGILYVMGGIPIFGLSALLVPLSIAFSIFRYRLWDIDLIIRRTLIYSVLTALLLTIYFSSVILLQQLFRAATGAAGSAEIVTVISTLAIATLFVPLRKRIQMTIDRRFYRRKYDAAKTLVAFSLMVRDEVDLSQLTERLLDVVDETMQPAHVSLWLKPTADHRRTTADH